MRMTLLIATLLMIFMTGCTKDNAKHSDEGAVLSEMTNSMPGIAFRSSPITLPRLTASSGSLEIDGAAFTAVCADAGKPRANARQCFYFAAKNDIYQICFPDKTKKLIYSVPKNQNAEDKIWGTFQVANGRMIWRSGLNLFTWDGSKAYSVLVDEKTVTAQNPLGVLFSDATSYLISPNGQCIVWNTNSATDSLDEEQPKVDDTVEKLHFVYAAKITATDLRKVASQSYSIKGQGMDYREEQRLLHWSKINPSTIYTTTWFEAQLYSGFKGILGVDFASEKERFKNGSVQQVLAFSPDETKIAYTPNDETCCSGSNYTNNTVVIRDLISGKEKTVYDEWREFGNEGKDEDYYLDKLITKHYTMLHETI